MVFKKMALWNYLSHLLGPSNVSCLSSKAGLLSFHNLAPTLNPQALFLHQVSVWVFPRAISIFPSISPKPQLLSRLSSHSQVWPLLMAKQKSKGIKELPLSCPIPLEFPLYCVRKNTKVITEEGNSEAVLVTDTPARISCQIQSSMSQGHERRRNQIWRRQENWGEQFGIGSLSSDGCDVGDPARCSAGEGSVGSEHLDGENLPKELQGVEK